MNTQCTNCFTDYIVQCNETINVFAKLAPNETFKWVITDKFDHQYEGEFTTDVNGFWQIDVDDLPEGLLTDYSGNFKLQVYPNEAYYSCDEPISFQIAQTFDCITFNVRGGNRTKANIGCEF